MDIETAISSLIDDPDFLAIDESRRRFNLFDAIGGQRAELRHSNFLKFILLPSQNHGLGARFVRSLLRAIIEKVARAERPISTLEVAVADIDQVVVFRELDYIDLLIEVGELNLVVLVENKIGAKAGDGQLQRYKTVVERKYTSWKKLFVFLTPTGIEPDTQGYVAFSYSELAALVDRLWNGHSETTCAPDVALILDHYTRMLRRHVVDDEQLRDVALRIYERHPDALDFIFRNKPQGTSLLPIAQALVKASPELSEDKHNASIFRFYPTSWSQIPALNACPITSWTKTGRNVLFEIKTFKSEGEFYDRLLLSLILGPSDHNLRRALFESVHKRKDIFRNPGKSIGQSWVTVFSTELLSEAAAENMDDAEKRASIEEQWRQFVSNDLPKLAATVIEIAESTSHKN